MLKKTIAVLILFTMLLSAFAACGNQVSTSAPTDAPTEAPTEKIPEPTEGESEYGSDTCTEPPMPSEQMTEILSEEPTEAETDVPTEECTHEWDIVPIEECTCCGERQPHTDKNGKEFVRYQVSGFCTVTRFSDDEVRECIDPVLLDLLNRQDWQVYRGYEYGFWPERAYSLTFADNVRFYYNCDERGQIVNYADGRWAQLSDDDANTLNRMLTALFPDSLSRQTIDRIELAYCGYGEKAYMIEDQEEIERLLNFIFEAKAKQVGESTYGYAGGSYSLNLYSGDECVFDLGLWYEMMYSTSMHKDPYGYSYFYYGDFSELYNYLSENYPHEFWFPES